MSWFNWAGGEDEPWRRLISDVPVEAVDEDSGELVEIKPKQDDPNDIEGFLVRFDYTDVVGNKSRRVILCRRCWETTALIYVQGFCTLRHALRTFRADHMRAVEDLRGKRKIADPAAFFAAFAEHEDAFPNRWAPPPAFDIDQWTIARQRLQRARETCIDGLRVLSYLALADDLVTDQERDIEKSYIRSRLAMCGLPSDDAAIDNMMDVTRTLTVPSRSFARSLTSIAKDKAHLNLVVAAAAQMAQSTPKLNSIERRALNDILSVAKAAAGENRATRS